MVAAFMLFSGDTVIVLAALAYACMLWSGAVWCAVQPGAGCGTPERTRDTDRALLPILTASMRGAPIEAHGHASRTDVDTDCSYTDWSSSGHDVHSLIGADPMFADADKRMFALKAGSPAFALGIVSIDVSDVGPRK